MTWTWIPELPAGSRPTWVGHSVLLAIFLAISTAWDMPLAVLFKRTRSTYCSILGRAVPMPTAPMAMTITSSRVEIPFWIDCLFMRQALRGGVATGLTDCAIRKNTLFAGHAYAAALLLKAGMGWSNGRDGGNELLDVGLVFIDFEFVLVCVWEYQGVVVLLTRGIDLGCIG